MTDIHGVGASQHATLAELNTIVAQREARLGPLAGIGHGKLDGDGSEVTILTFDMDSEPPATKAVLRQCIGTKPPPLAKGETLIGTGECWVTAQLLFLAAIRT